MKNSLQVRLSQNLVLTPQLQQSIRLLQLSTLDLHQEIEQMLEQNPFLEADEERTSPPEQLGELSLSASERATEREAEPDAATTEPAGLDTAEFGGTERDDWENGTEREDFDGIRETPSKGSGDSDEFDGQERDASPETLQDHLRQQLLGMRLGAEDADSVRVLIDSLNEDGYLDDSLQAIAEQLTGCAAAPHEKTPGRSQVFSSPSGGLAQSDRSGGANHTTPPPRRTEACNALLEQLQCGLRWVQSMEPTGVGARDLAECLVLQLRTLERSPEQMIAIMICKQHLDLLARRDMKKLMNATGADEDLLREAQNLITHLEPKPGRRFVQTERQVVVPDVIVRKLGRGWRAQLNPDVMPKLRINDLYASAIRQGKNDPNGLGSHLQEARWFMKNILQRFDTIQRVSQAIIERQKNFFTHGAIAMKPLILREIADEMGLHESTISRATTAKYMATPFGTFELKYFFGSSLHTDAGGNASSTAVRVLIKQLIAAENPDNPLSDSQIAQTLEEQGIKVARRTVAKYREGLGIAPIHLRKTM
jgi:RNA polymerase sigma-54 factor